MTRLYALLHLVNILHDLPQTSDQCFVKGGGKSNRRYFGRSDHIDHDTIRCQSWLRVSMCRMHLIKCQAQQPAHSSNPCKCSLPAVAVKAPRAAGRLQDIASRGYESEKLNNDIILCTHTSIVSAKACCSYRHDDWNDSSHQGIHNETDCCQYQTNTSASGSKTHSKWDIASNIHRKRSARETR